MKKALTTTIAAFALLLAGCTIPTGAELPAVNGHQCWSPATGWQETTNGKCIYTGPPIVITPPPTAPTTDPCLILEGCKP